MAKVGSAIPKQGSCPRQRGGDLPSEACAMGCVLPIRDSLGRRASSRPRLGIGRRASSRLGPGIIPARAAEVTHSMAALRDSLNACAACTLPEVPLHWRYAWDAYHVGSAGQGAAGFSPRGPSDGATAGIHGAGGIGGLLAVEARQSEGDPLRHWYFYDGNGNVGQVPRYAAQANPPVTLGAHYEYDAYGQTLTVHDADASGYAAANPFRFSTKWFDAETGLGYWGYRYYTPDLGRWMSRDPIEEQGGLNLYLFTQNQSPNMLDLLGQLDLLSLQPGTWEFGIPVGHLPCQVVLGVTVRQLNPCCKEIDVFIGGSCSIKDGVVRHVSRLPYVGVYVGKAMNSLPDVSAQIWGQESGKICTHCWEFCEVSLNGAVTVGEGRRGSGRSPNERKRRSPFVGFGVSGELNGILNWCHGTLRLDGTVVGSVSVNVTWPVEIAYNRDFERSGTIIGPARYDPWLTVDSGFSCLKWGRACSN
ncbi:MAG: RHS repeat-associated core domain-containing protein [Phycisphaerae bacterium]|nr:RHS repeat-associated core domain-containing protein [Phycisphaerae bacterium]